MIDLPNKARHFMGAEFKNEKGDTNTMNNETKILSRRGAVEILGKLYARQNSAGAWKYLSDDEMTALNAAIFALEKDIHEQENTAADGWTPIEKGLPPEDGWYIVKARCNGGSVIMTSDLFQQDRDGGFLLHKNVIAWKKQPNICTNTWKGGETS